MTDGYTFYDWSLPITQEDAIVHHSCKIDPTVTSPEGEGSFPCWDGLCHEIERDSPRSDLPRLTFVVDSGRLLLTGVKSTRVISYIAPRLYQNHRYTIGHPYQMFFCELELGYHNVSSDGFVPYTGYYVVLC